MSVIVLSNTSSCSSSSLFFFRYDVSLSSTCSLLSLSSTCFIVIQFCSDVVEEPSRGLGIGGVANVDLYPKSPSIQPGFESIVSTSTRGWLF